jgi:hypothetical protein
LWAKANRRPYQPARGRCRNINLAPKRQYGLNPAFFFQQPKLSLERHDGVANWRCPSTQLHKNKDEGMPTQNPHRIVGLCTSSKVYNALTELKHLEGHRSAKFLSLLAENLVRKGLLNEQEVVHMLDLVVD